MPSLIYYMMTWWNFLEQVIPERHYRHYQTLDFKTPVPEFIDPVFTKTSRKHSFSVIENERFRLVFVKTGSINSGTGQIMPDQCVRPWIAYSTVWLITTAPRRALTHVMHQKMPGLWPLQFWPYQSQQDISSLMSGHISKGWFFVPRS